MSTNFTLEDIQAAHAKVKTGADFPRYVSDLAALGVLSYKARFLERLGLHQHGGTTYPEFCADAAACGVAKWTVDTIKRTCVYVDGFGHEMLVEEIPRIE